MNYYVLLGCSVHPKHHASLETLVQCLGSFLNAGISLKRAKDVAQLVGLLT